jgi:hypothetical protein
MPIPVTCPCGKTIRAPDNAVGKDVRCPSCRRAVLVPAAARPPRPRDEDEDLAADDAPRRPAKRPKKRSGKPSQTTVLLLVGCFGLTLLGCLGTAGGLAVLYFRFAGPSADEQLIGVWEMDPDYLKQQARDNPLGAQVFSECKLAFNADHTYKLSCFIEQEGKWQVVGGDRKTAKVKLVARVLGMDAEPITVTITFVDRDHMEFESNQKGLTLNGRFHRTGPGK